MATELILREYVEHLGNRGDVVKVADGYARNYLLPRGLALRVTGEARRQIEREREKAGARELAEKQAAEAVAAALAAADLSIARRVGDHNTLYGSVTTSDIAEALAARQITIDRRKILLDEPLKTLGAHEVTIKLHRDVPASVTVTIVPAQMAGQAPIAAPVAAPDAPAADVTDTPAE